MQKMMSIEFRGRETSRRNSPTSDEYEGRQQGQNKPHKGRETLPPLRKRAKLQNSLYKKKLRNKSKKLRT